MYNILVVGGAGYIGSQTNLFLLKNNFKTVVFDNLQKGHKQAIPDESIFFEGDLLDQESLDKVFEKHKIDAVIHFAAFIEVSESQKDPQKYYQNNLVGSFNLLKSMNKFGVKKIVFSSTAAVYGLPKVIPIKEDSPKNPINTYGRTKYMVEQILQDYHTSNGFSGICLRYFNACGADSQARTGERHQPETHLIPLILQSLNSTNPKFTIFGNDYNTPDGTCIRDYIHTQDLANGHILALNKLLDSEETIFESINLATGQGFSNLEIIRAVEKITNQKIEINYGKRRAGDPDILIADNTKAKDLLKFKPEYSTLENIIITAWQWDKKLNNNSFI